MKLETCKRAIEELRGEGLQVSWLVLDSRMVEDLLGLEAAHQAEAAAQDEPDTELAVGEVDGVPVYSSMVPNPHFVTWRQPVPDADGMMPVSASGRRYFQVAGDYLMWLTVDPVGTVMEGCEFEGWRPTWVRLPEMFREYAREYEGVDVQVGGPGPLMVFEGNAEKVRVVMFESDGLSAAWLASFPVGGEALDEVLGAVRDHVGWTGHRLVTMRSFKDRHSIYGWESCLGCGVCGWEVWLSELACVAAGRWDLMEEAGLTAEAARLADGPVYERPSVWGRLADEDGQ